MLTYTGLALGFQSVVIPVFIISGIIYMSFKMVGMYGVATAGSLRPHTLVA
jgi:Na+/H+-translocating membrane pyrophosphatase